MAAIYQKKNALEEDQTLSGYTMIQPITDRLWQDKHLVGYKNQNTKDRDSYMKRVVAHAKLTPNPFKYNK